MGTWIPPQGEGRPQGGGCIRNLLQPSRNLNLLQVIDFIRLQLLLNLLHLIIILPRVGLQQALLDELLHLHGNRLVNLPEEIIAPLVELGTCRIALLSGILDLVDGSVSLSTIEAEYKAFVHAAQKCMWLRRLFEDLHVPIDQPVHIHRDNLSAIKLASNPVFHARTKHIELEHHFIREKVLDMIIDMVAVRSEDNIADIFKKSLMKGAFEDLRSKLGLVTRTSL